MIYFSALMQERIVCSVQAAQRYGLPPSIVLAVAEQEGGRPGLAMRNANGTYDLGAMQLNTAYLATLARYGVRAEDAQRPGCYPYQIASWRIRRHLQFDRGDYWTRVAHYHSYSPAHNAQYRAMLIARAARWSNWLQEAAKRQNG